MSKSFWFFVFLKCSWMWFILLVFEMGIFTTIHIFKLRMCYSGNGLLDGGSDHEQVPTPKHRPVHRGLLWETPKVKLDDDDYIGILWESYWDIVMIILGYYDRVKNDDDDDDDDYIGILWGGWKMMIKSAISNLTCLIEQQMGWKLSVNFQEEKDARW